MDRGTRPGFGPRSSSTRTASSSAGGSWAPGTPATAFARARLVDVELVRCDLAGCDFSEAVFHRVRLTDCRGIGIELGGASVAFGDGRRLPARRRELPHRRSSRRCASRHRYVRRADFGGARLDEVAVPGVRPRRRRLLERAYAPNVDLRGARLDGLQGVGSLRGATIGIDQLFGLAPGLAAAVGLRILSEEDGYGTGEAPLPRLRPPALERPCDFGQRSGPRLCGSELRPSIARATCLDSPGLRSAPGSDLRLTVYFRPLQSATGLRASGVPCWPPAGTDRSSSRGRRSRDPYDHRGNDHNPDLPHAQGLLRPQLQARQLRRRLRGRRVGAQPATPSSPRRFTAGLLLNHRGAAGAEADTGDGAGVTIQTPDAFYRASCHSISPAGSSRRDRVLPVDDLDGAVRAVEKVLLEEGFSVLWLAARYRSAARYGWSARDVPRVPPGVHVGRTAGRGRRELERHVYVARKRLDHAVPVMLGDNRGRCTSRH